MTAEEYIISILKNWETLFPGIHLQYTYEKETGYHIILVSPDEICHNEDYINQENSLCDSFRKNYPEEEILISEPIPSLCTFNTYIYETK